MRVCPYLARALNSNTDKHHLAHTPVTCARITRLHVAKALQLVAIRQHILSCLPFTICFFLLTGIVLARDVVLQFYWVSIPCAHSSPSMLIAAHVSRSMQRNQRPPRRSTTPTSANFPSTDSLPPPTPTSPSAQKPLYLCSPFVEAALVKGNFKTIVMLPKYADVMEWVAVNSACLTFTLCVSTPPTLIIATAVHPPSLPQCSYSL